MSKPYDRRSFLKHSLLSAAALSLSPRDVLSRHSLAPKKVIVVGGGLAGLCAAYELREAGHEVTVLEARTRPGGRVFTIRGQFADGLFAEAGATNVYDVHEWTLKYLKLLGLDLDPLSVTPGGSIFHVQGRRIVVKPGQPVDWPFEFSAAEKGMGRRELWQDDEPFSRGAYAWFKSGEMTELMPHIPNREGRIHFCGDHTSQFPGWMNGALQSGYRAANEVHEASQAASVSTRH